MLRRLRDPADLSDVALDDTHHLKSVVSSIHHCVSLQITRVGRAPSIEYGDEVTDSMRPPISGA